MNQKRLEDFRRGWARCMEGRSANVLVSADEFAGWDAAALYGPNVSDETRDSLAASHLRVTAAPAARPEMVVEPDGDLLWVA